jgi:acetyl-CoA carboxylase biotin carboxylase subunit
MFKKILVANRGEIAVRVLRACRELGICGVAVYSEPDAAALHVLKADEAYCIGPGPASESYLRADRILDTAARCGADAVHPGYGFLAENAHFAEQCAGAGIDFIGPPPAAMRTLGDKVSAIRLARRVGVPVLSGSGGVIADMAAASAAAGDIGYPVMLKAAAGGGGKGMRLVEAEAAMEHAWRLARGEAEAAFGDGTLFVEKYLESPRHVEIQVLGDRHGNVVYFPERECSLQRRHQKIVEESPSPAVSRDLRAEMGRLAVILAREAGYENAGTVEYLLDRNGAFHFLEMNTRLQVEHPVTEAITGWDLVHLQIRAAAGEKLAVTQAAIEARGHAIECRIYAEDPDNGFAPSPGRVELLEEPAGPGIRNDTGVYAGAEIPVYYDPLISKLIVSAHSRSEALDRMQRALWEYRIAGVRTSIPFLRTLLGDSRVSSGALSTELVATILSEQRHRPAQGWEDAVLAAALMRDEGLKLSSAPLSPWRLEGREL